MSRLVATKHSAIGSHIWLWWFQIPKLAQTSPAKPSLRSEILYVSVLQLYRVVRFRIGIMWWNHMKERFFTCVYNLPNNWTMSQCGSHDKIIFLVCCLSTIALSMINRVERTEECYLPPCTCDYEGQFKLWQCIIKPNNRYFTLNR